MSHRIEHPYAEEWLDDEGLRHREDGPAFTHNNGISSWYRHGELHREDGPAVLIEGFSQQWYFNGLRHRWGGPAVEFHPSKHPDWEDEYWVMGSQAQDCIFRMRFLDIEEEMYS